MADAYFNFDAEDFRELIYDFGERVRWWRGLDCPNCSAPQNNADPDSCPHDCKDGKIYAEEDLETSPRDEWRLYIDGLNKMINHPQLGRVPSGSGNVMGMYDEFRFNDLDYFVLIEREDWTTETITKGRDRLSHPDVVRIDRLEIAGTEYIEGTDWELNSGVISWIDGGAAPASGAAYSVEYTFYPRVWVVGKARRLARNDQNGNPIVLRGQVAYRHPSDQD